MLGGMIVGPLAGIVTHYASEPVVEVYQNRRRRKLADRKSKRAARTAALEDPPL